jgi:hypothetical protein
MGLMSDEGQVKKVDARENEMKGQKENGHETEY